MLAVWTAASKVAMKAETMVEKKEYSSAGSMVEMMAVSMVELMVSLTVA